jgi:hypothetical protein
MFLQSTCKNKTAVLSLWLAAVCSSDLAKTVLGFTVPMFHESVAMQRTAPSKTDGVEIELPDFDELFGRIQMVSPLARLAIEGGGSGPGGGFGMVDDSTWPKEMGKWKTIENNKKRVVHKIDKIENFQKLGCPIVRFRASLNGPCSGTKMSEFIMDLDERKKWDMQISDVEEIFPIYDMEAANLAMGVGKYGDCSKLGIGYCQTKPNIVTDGREQLTLCGVQHFADGSSMIWGTEMEDWHNDLFPDCPRRTRAKSHLFSTCLVPTGPNTFDVEYVLQLEIGGKIPSFLTTPVLVETVKSMFRHAEKIYGDEEIMAPYRVASEINGDEMLSDRYSLLMTP